MKNKLHYLIAFSLASIIFTGCSSSSDSNGSNGGGVNTSKAGPIDRKPAEITAANAQDVVDMAFSSLDVLEFSGMAIDSTDDLKTSSIGKAKLEDQELRGWNFKNLISYSKNSVTPAANESGTDSCPDGGSTSYSVTEKSLGEHKVQETITANFNKCKFFGMVLNGNTKMELTTTHLSPITKIYDFKQTINNLSFSGSDLGESFNLVMNGNLNGVCEDMHITDSCTLTSDSLEIAVNEFWVRIFDAEFINIETAGGMQSLKADYKINSSELKGMLHTETLKTLKYSGMYELPDEGKIQVKGASNNIAEIEFRLENIGFWEEPVADIKVTYAGGSCSATGITVEELDDGDWVCK